MIATILSWLSGGIVGQIGKQLNEAYRARLQAQNDSERIAADKEISFWSEQMGLARTAASEDRWWSPRSLMGWIVTAFVFKIIMLDTVLQLSVTPDPGPLVKGIALTVIGFYFGSKAVADIGAALLRRGK